LFAIVDEKALIRALSAKKIRGAALDVFDKEPLEPGHALFKLDNVLLFPHCADKTARSHEESAEWFVKNAVEFAAGRPLLSLVDKRAGY
jgi:phosphoglycerate dehydrogenase-like enzyme